METINEIQDAIIEEFSAFEDWMDRYQMIIDMAQDVPSIQESDKTQDKLIDGCQSRVWLKAEFHDDKLWFSADSDAIITKGLIGLLIRVWSGQTPADILASEPYFIDKLGLSAHLSPTRSNGFVSMIKQIRAYAMACNK